MSAGRQRAPRPDAAEARRVGDADGHATRPDEAVISDEGDDGHALVVPITGELDLHAFAPRDIPALVADYVEACREAGVRELRLVHGRGKGVQRAVVRRVLAGLGGIADVRDAPPGSGGWGATLARVLDHAPRER